MFKIGDVVQLKSGGAKMTVSFPTTMTEATCVFFDGQGEMDSAKLPIECLKLVGPTKRTK